MFESLGRSVCLHSISDTEKDGEREQRVSNNNRVCMDTRHEEKKKETETVHHYLGHEQSSRGSSSSE